MTSGDDKSGPDDETLNLIAQVIEGAPVMAGHPVADAPPPPPHPVDDTQAGGEVIDASEAFAAKRGKKARKGDSAPARTGKDGGDGGGKSFTLRLPDDCPVRPLGVKGRNIYYLDGAAQLIELSDKEHGRLPLTHLFGGNLNYLTANWPSYGKGGAVSGPAFELVAASLTQAAFRRGRWDARDKVRGRGCWLSPDGELIVHCGDRVLVGQRDHAPGEVDGMIYPADERIMPPATPAEIRAAQDGPGAGAQLLTLLRQWNWKRPDIDPVLLLGWVGAAFLGASLRWRPMIFLVGDRATGKSTLHEVLKGVFGSWLLWSDDSTEAGISSALSLDSLPVGIDEAEHDPNSSNGERLMTLARRAAGGGTKRRGTTGHESREFTARSAMIFSAINPIPMRDSEMSRFGILQLRPLPKGAKRPDLNALMLGQIGRRCLARLIGEHDQLERRFRFFADVLHAGGHEGRGQDTYGVLLAVAETLLGADHEALGVPFGDEVSRWGHLMAAAQLDETADSKTNWRRCLDHLMTVPVDAWRGGSRLTVGAVLEDWHSGLERGFNTESDDLSTAQAQKLLRMAGLKLRPPTGHDDEWRLFIPNNHDMLKRLFKGSDWYGGPSNGGWKLALQQAPDAFWKKDHGRCAGTVTWGTVFLISECIGIETAPAPARAVGDDNYL
jgi:hypothetical protein